MYYIKLTLVLTVVCVKCNPVILQKSSETLQEMSLSGIIDIMNMMNALKNIESECTTTNSTGMNTLFCSELIKENNNYVPLEHIIQTKTKEIQSVLKTMLILEKKAIFCRGMRYLLPVTMYGIFINNILNGLIEIDNSEMDIFDELYEVDSDISNDENSSNENIIKDIKKSMSDNDNNDNLSVEYSSKGDLTETHIDFIKKFRTIVINIQRFIREKELKCFHDFYKTHEVIMSTPPINTKSYHDIFVSVFKEMRDMYKSECSVDVNVAKLFETDNVNKIKQKNYTIPELVEETNRLFVRVQEDLKLLYVKFYPSMNVISFTNISMVYYHSFNKYLYPEVWTLIGDETIMNESIMISLNRIMPDNVKRIGKMVDQIEQSMKVSVKCRCFVYIQLMLKLYLIMVHMFMENVHKIRLMANELSKDVGRSISKYVMRTSGYMPTVVHMTTNELLDVFFFVHEEISEDIEIYDHGGITDPNSAIWSTVMDGSDQHDEEDDFETVFAIYSEYAAYNIDEAIGNIVDNLQSVDFELEFNPISYEMGRDTSRKLTRKIIVSNLMKWYERTGQMYENNCFSSVDIGNNSARMSTLNEEMEQVLFISSKTITLDWVILKMDNLVQELLNDLNLIEHFNLII